MFQIVASFTDDSRGTIYNHTIFIIQVAEEENSLLNAANESSAKIQISGKWTNIGFYDSNKHSYTTGLSVSSFHYFQKEKKNLVLPGQNIKNFVRL